MRVPHYPLLVALLALLTPIAAADQSLDLAKAVSTLSPSQLAAQLVQIQTTRYLTQDPPASRADLEKLITDTYASIPYGSAFDLPSSAPQVSILSLPSFAFDALTVPSMLNLLHPSWHTYSPTAKTTALYSLPLHAVDSIHGSNYFPNTVLYPQSINIAATFDARHGYNEGYSSCASTLASSNGAFPWIFSPLFGVSLSPAWARVYETYGESWKVVSEMAGGYVAGAGGAAGSGGRCATTAKHYLGYSHNAGKDRTTSRAATRDRKVWAKNLLNSDPGRADTVMTSYSQANQEYSVNFDRAELSNLRRWFDGVVVTDFDEVNNAVGWHRNAGDLRAALKRLYAFDGVDVLMAPDDTGECVDGLVELIESGEVERKLIEKKVLR